jgi:nucleotide-binding universal stress UspA family protein
MPPRYKGIAKEAPCPVYLVPGTILVPVDNTETPHRSIERIEEEVKMTGASVLLLGVVPVHLYSREEKRELEQVKKGTLAEMKSLRNALAELGIDASEVLRSGYPDLEILKAAEEHTVSIIILPSEGATPSELSKAASILMDESNRVKCPVMLVAQAETA